MSASSKRKPASLSFCTGSSSWDMYPAMRSSSPAAADTSESIPPRSSSPESRPFTTSMADEMRSEFLAMSRLSVRLSRSPGVMFAPSSSSI